MKNYRWTLAFFCVGLACLVPNALTGDIEAKAVEKARVLVLPGHVEAEQFAELHSLAGGVVRRVMVDIGHQVKAGEVLAEIDVPDLEHEMNIKNAQLRLAEAEFELAKRSEEGIETEIMVARASVEDAKALVELARAQIELQEADYVRMQKLVERAAASKADLGTKRQEFEKAKADLRAAEAKVKAAQFVEDAAKRGPARIIARSKVAEAKLRLAQAEFDRARRMMDTSRVIAPFDGIIVRRSVAPGAFVASALVRKGEPLFALARIDSVRVVVQVPEYDLARLKPGRQVAKVKIVSQPELQLVGKLVRVAPILDKETQSLHAEILLLNPERRLLPGMKVEVSFSPDAADKKDE